MQLLLQIIPGFLLENIWKIVFAVFVIWCVALLFRPKKALKNWHHYFEGLQISSKDVYDAIMIEAAERQMPITFYFRKYFEGGLHSARREYLSVSFDRFYFDISCMAHGTGYYVSWWLGQEDVGMLGRIPILNDILGLNPKYPSYYQLDMATRFQSGLHDVILSVLDKIGKEKGIRPLTETERQPITGRL